MSTQRDPSLGAAATRARRRARAVEMANLDFNWDEIADDCGYASVAEAIADVDQAVREAAVREAAPAEELLRKRVAMLEASARQQWKIADTDYTEETDYETPEGVAGTKVVTSRAASAKVNLLGLEGLRRTTADLVKLQGVDKLVKADDGLDDSWDVTIVDGGDGA